MEEAAGHSAPHGILTRSINERELEVDEQPHGAVEHGRLVGVGDPFDEREQPSVDRLVLPGNKAVEDREDDAVVHQGVEHVQLGVRGHQACEGPVSLDQRRRGEEAEGARVAEDKDIFAVVAK